MIDLYIWMISPWFLIWQFCNFCFFYIGISRLEICGCMVQFCIIHYYFLISFLFSFIPGVVIQLKTIAGAVSVDESFSNFTMERTGFLQKILVYVVSIMCGFIDLSPEVHGNSLLYSNTTEFSIQRDGASPTDSSSSLKAPFCETRLNWHKKAVVSVMEAGGVNWLVGKVGNLVFFSTFWLGSRCRMRKAASHLIGLLITLAYQQLLDCSIHLWFISVHLIFFMQLVLHWTWLVLADNWSGECRG